MRQVQEPQRLLNGHRPQSLGRQRGSKALRNAREPCIAAALSMIHGMLSIESRGPAEIGLHRQDLPPTSRGTRNLGRETPPAPPAAARDTVARLAVRIRQKYCHQRLPRLLLGTPGRGALLARHGSPRKSCVNQRPAIDRVSVAGMPRLCPFVQSGPCSVTPVSTPAPSRGFWSPTRLASGTSICPEQEQWQKFAPTAPYLAERPASTSQRPLKGTVATIEHRNCDWQDYVEE